MAQMKIYKGSVLKAKAITVMNDVGGIEYFQGNYPFTVREIRHDPRTGWIYEGHLNLESDIREVEKATKTGQKNIVGEEEYDPSRVFVSEHDLDRPKI